MKSFFSFSLLFFSSLSFANHYDESSPEFHASVQLGQIQAAEETEILGEKTSNLAPGIEEFSRLVKEQVDAVSRIFVELGREFSTDKKEESNFHSDTEASSSDSSLSQPSDGSGRDSIIHEGWLRKKLSGKREKNEKNWVKRWVVLTSTSLIYYVDQDKKKPKNQVSKKRFAIQEEGESDTRIHMNGPSMRDWIFEAESPEERQIWLEKFKEFKPDEEEREKRTWNRKKRKEEEEKKAERERLTYEARIVALRKKLEEFRELEEGFLEKIEGLEQAVRHAKSLLFRSLRSLPGAEEERSLGNPF